MTEDAQLDAALRKADDVLTASLRREEAKRQSRRTSLFIALAFLLGIACGAIAMHLWTASTPATPARPLAASPTPSLAAPTTGPCEVKWGAEWRRATILSRDGNLFQIQYDGWNDFFNEWVTPDRIRAIGSTRDIPYAKPTPHGQKPPQPLTPD